MSSFVLRAALLLVTGIAALLFEMASMRSVASWLGDTPSSSMSWLVVALVASGAGAYLLGRRADRAGSPMSRFRCLVGAAGVIALASPWLLDQVGPWILPQLGIEESVGRTLYSVLLLVLVPGAVSFLLGAGIPSLIAAGDESEESGDAGYLFAAGTLGCFAGVALAGFVTLEHLGIRWTALIGGGLLILAAGATLLSSRVGSEASPSAAIKRATGEPVRFAWLVIASSAFGLAASTVALSRLLTQYLAGSAWTTAMVAVVSTFGISLGAAVGAWLARRSSPDRSLVPMLLPALAAAIGLAGPLVQMLAGGTRIGGIHPWWSQLTVISGLVLPAVVCGALLAALVTAHREREAGRGFARVIVWSSLGSLTGALVVGVFALPRLGLPVSMMIAVALPMAAAIVRLRPRVLPIAAACVGAVFASALWNVDFEAKPKDRAFSELLEQREGAVARVSVLKSPLDPRPALFVDGVARGGGQLGRRLERRQALIPSALHGDVESVLALGIGTGESVTAAIDGGARNVVVVDPVKDIFDVLPLFFSTGRSPVDHPGVEGVVYDPAAFVRQTHGRFDLVIGDRFTPWLDGAGALYSREHFEAVRGLLKERGMFLQWVPLKKLRWENFGLLARTFTKVFPQTKMFLLDGRSRFPVVGLLGAVEPLRIASEDLEARITADSAERSLYEEVGVSDAGDLLELYLGDQHTIDAQFGGDRALGEERLLNTYDRPVLEYRASRAADEEPVLGLNNLNNVPLYLGGLVTDLLPPPVDDAEREARQETDMLLRRRSSAMMQFLAGRYWRLRSEVEGEDRMALEDREVEKYLQGLVYDPDHELLNRAVIDVCKLRLRERRHTAAAQLGESVFHNNPENADAAFSVGLAYLFLGEPRLSAAALQAASDLSPEDPEFLSRLGIARYLNGEAAAALPVLLEAQKNSPVRLDDFAFAVAFACSGDRENALRSIAKVINDPLWGTAARQARGLFEAMPAESTPAGG